MLTQHSLDIIWKYNLLTHFIHTLMARFNLKVYSGMQVCQEKSQIEDIFRMSF